MTCCGIGCGPTAACSRISGRSTGHKKRLHLDFPIPSAGVPISRARSDTCDSEAAEGLAGVEPGVFAIAPRHGGLEGSQQAVERTAPSRETEGWRKQRLLSSCKPPSLWGKAPPILQDSCDRKSTRRKEDRGLFPSEYPSCAERTGEKSSNGNLSTLACALLKAIPKTRGCVISMAHFTAHR